MESEVVKIDLNYDFKKYLSEMMNEGEEFEKLIRSINFHAQGKVIYLPINGNKLSPVLMTLASDKDLTSYSYSLNYRLQSLYFQSHLIEVIVNSGINDFKNEFFRNHDKILQEQVMQRLHLQLNTLLDNLIIHSLSLFEYSLTFVSHFCFKQVVNDWKNFYSILHQTKENDFLMPFCKKYNKTILSLKDYRNKLIHKNINGFPFGWSLSLMPKEKEEMISIKIGINLEIQKM